MNKSHSKINGRDVQAADDRGAGFHGSPGRFAARYFIVARTTNSVPERSDPGRVCGVFLTRERRASPPFRQASRGFRKA